MELLEKVELIREKTGVSYEDAKAALVACNEDVLDAIVYLEKLGKVVRTQTASYSTEQGQTQSQSKEFMIAQQKYEKDCNKKSFGDLLKGFLNQCVKLLKKSCETSFEVYRKGAVILSVPVLVLIICFLFAFWGVLALLIVGLFCDCKYYFKGFAKMHVDLNDMCEKASETAEQIKNDLNNTINN